MSRLLFALTGAIGLMLTTAPPSAEAALICKDGQLHYGGSGFYANRVQAEASAVRAWRRVQAVSIGAKRAANMFPKSGQLHCDQAPTGEGWRCFVRGGHCHTA
jgi:hypothetical protein